MYYNPNLFLNVIYCDNTLLFNIFGDLIKGYTIQTIEPFIKTNIPSVGQWLNQFNLNCVGLAQI